MSYQVEKIPGEPVILVTLTEAFDIAQSGNEVVEKVISLLDNVSSPVYYVNDASHIRINFGDMVGMMGFVTKGNTALLKHPNIKEIVIVTSSDLVVMGAKALGQSQYGELPVSVFGSPEEAFDYVKEHSV